MSNYKCVMLFPRRLHISNLVPPYWAWNCYKETSDNVEVAKLRTVCWLDVRGHIKMSELSCGVVYEIAYIVKLTNGASGWELPITLKLRYPDGREQIRQQSLLEKPRGEWMELSGGTFLTNQEETGEFWFDLCEHGGHWKTGLIIKGIIAKPK
uniref:protein PHLOEM PROTEIN 2-LIKE A1-like n=1 Tax=Fragaria vesca subsp. vesca TaxID=101020 RepID=UPI0005C9695C|nr:PREDICTED: protein PHLOEM PROTEIN 2-LIKE A1-like [Fragaria vesca subsp. vesca]